MPSAPKGVEGFFVLYPAWVQTDGLKSLACLSSVKDITSDQCFVGEGESEVSE